MNNQAHSIRGMDFTCGKCGRDFYWGFNECPYCLRKKDNQDKRDRQDTGAVFFAVAIGLCVIALLVYMSLNPL